MTVTTARPSRLFYRSRRGAQAGISLEAGSGA
jgi:hypothetical protein